MSEKVQRLAVASYQWRGHIPTYHRLFIESGRRLGCEIVSLAPESVAGVECVRFGVDPNAQESSAVAAASTRTWRDAVRRALAPTGILGARHCRRVWRNLGSAVASTRPPIDAVIITYLADGFLGAWTRGRWVDRILPVNWAGCWNAPSVDRANESPRVDGPLDARHCRGVWIPDRGVAQAWAQRRPSQPVREFPEIADLSTGAMPTELEEVRRAAAGRKIVALLGNLAARKGIFTFIAAARRAELEGVPLFFVAAGEMTRTATGADYDRLAAIAREPRGNLRILPRRLSDGAEFNAWVAAADVLFCAYWDFPYSSNLLTKAAHFGKPVLVSQGGGMERTLQEYQLGLSVPQRDVDAALEALRRLASGGLPAARSAEYAKAHGPDRLDALVSSLLNPECGHV